MNKLKLIDSTCAILAATTSAAVLSKTAKEIKDKKFCPICSAKKILNKVKLNLDSVETYNNAVALTPPMGWSSWNLFRNQINEDLIKEIADAMVKIGLYDAGYKYVNIDDCWQSSKRDENGRLQADPVHFKSGIKSLSEYVNSIGLKLGIYSSNGTLTCEDYPASLRNEKIDAETFAQWGIEYFKYDFCHNEKIPSDAPKIANISVSNKSNSELIATYTPYDLTLKKMARIVPEPEIINGAYIDGLDSRNGAVEFNVEAHKDGVYTLSFVLKKSGKNEKFALITVNATDEYHLYVPGTKGWTLEGKAHLDVFLKNGVNTVKIENPVGSAMDSARIQYTLMGKELQKAVQNYAKENNTEPKPIVYSICEWGLNKPWKWGIGAGNLWRTTPDIKPFWLSVIGIYEFTVRLSKYAKKGNWNDPDMLEVGNGNLTFEENKSHFSLWCMMCAPLILGNDIRSFIKADGTIDTDNKVYQILTNKDMISINQDKLGIACKRIKFGLTDILIKPLENSKAAVLVLNKSNSTTVEKLDFNKISNDGILNLPSKSEYKAYDVWQKVTYNNVSTLDAEVLPHGVKVFIVE